MRDPSISCHHLVSGLTSTWVNIIIKKPLVRHLVLDCVESKQSRWCAVFQSELFYPCGTGPCLTRTLGESFYQEINECMKTWKYFKTPGCTHILVTLHLIAPSCCSPFWNLSNHHQHQRHFWSFFGGFCQYANMYWSSQVVRCRVTTIFIPLVVWRLKHRLALKSSWVRLLCPVQAWNMFGKIQGTSPCPHGKTPGLVDIRVIFRNLTAQLTANVAKLCRRHDQFLPRLICWGYFSLHFLNLKYFIIKYLMRVTSLAPASSSL